MKRIHGLYAITPDEQSTERLLESVRLAIEGGASVVQYRNKQADQVGRLWQAQSLRSLTRAHDVRFIVNDSVELARTVEADGVHLGGADGDIAAARALMPGKLIGASCYNNLQSALAAQAAGADYVAFGAAFPSPTKPQAVHARLSLFRQAKQSLRIPVVAIGGITVQNASALIEAGVDALAVITALFAAEDIKAAAQAFARLFQESRHAYP